MTDIEPLPERVERLEHKLDALSASVDRRFDDVNKRFDDVDKRFDEVFEHFVEQRQYTEFALEKLRAEMLNGFRRIEGRLDRFEDKFDQFVASQVRLARRQRSRRVSKKR